jgi:hypothetical protein
MTFKPPPSGWMYVLGIALVFGGCGASCGITLIHSSAKVDAMQRLVMPGQHEGELAAGSHVLYAETRSTVDGKGYVWNGGTLQCDLVDSASNQPVPMRTATASENYSFGGFAGQSMFEFDIATAGRYRLACEAESGPMVVALSQGAVLGSMFYAMLGGFVVAAAGLTTILLTWDKRRKHRVV